MISLGAIRTRDESDRKAYPGNLSVPELDRRDLLLYVDALLAAAGKVTCFRCGGTGLVARIETTVTNTEHSASASSRWVQDSCESCADLLRLMKEAGR